MRCYIAVWHQVYIYIFDKVHLKLTQVINFLQVVILIFPQSCYIYTF